MSRTLGKVEVRPRRRLHSRGGIKPTVQDLKISTRLIPQKVCAIASAFRNLRCLGAQADFNQVVYWSRPLSWKNQTLTPNPDTIYVFPFFNTKDVGPMVLAYAQAQI